MVLKNITLTAAIALVLSACSSGGSSNLNKTVNLSELKAQRNAELQAKYGEDKDGNKKFESLDTYEITIDGKKYSGSNLDLGSLGQGLQRLDVQEKGTAKISGETYTATMKSKLHLYQQPYSIIAGMQRLGGSVTGSDIGDPIDPINLDIDTVKGQTTQALPTAGIYNYSGIAFTQDEQGKLDYQVDFDKHIGSGSITGITEAGKITLETGNIGKLSHTNFDKSVVSGHGITGAAKSERHGEGTYKLGFFGPNAEEIAGVVEQKNQGLVGFGGTKQ